MEEIRNSINIKRNNSPGSKFPNFFIIGAPRSATTSLFFYLRQHPQIFMPQEKEPEYFIQDKPKGPLKPKNLDSYKKLFKDVKSEKAIGEASVRYLHNSSTAKLIKQRVPHAKLIVILRNPLDRAFSTHVLKVRNSANQLKDYGELLANQEKEISGDWGQSDKWSGIKGSFYYESLSNYYSLFSEDQIRTYLFEELISNPLSIVKDIFNFLDVDENFVPVTSVALNKRASTSGFFGNSILHLRTILHPLIGKVAGEAFLRSIGKFIYSSSLFSKPTLTKETYNKFCHIFSQDIRKTEKLIKKDLSSWLKPRKINILFLDHQTEVGGGELFLKDLIKELDKDLFNSIVSLGSSGGFKDILEKDGIGLEVFNLPEYFKFVKRDPQERNNFFNFVKSVLILPKLIKKTEKIIKDNKIDMVFANTIKSAFYGIPAARKAKIKSIWAIHDCLSKDFYSSFFLKAIKRLANKTNRVVFPSEVTRDCYLKLSHKKTFAAGSVIYNGVDLDKFKPGGNGQHFKQELSLGRSRIISLIGRLESWKGQKVFIKAAKIILDEFSDLKFLIVGGALFGQEKYAKECKNLVEELGLSDRVIFLGFRQDIPAIISISDIIVHTSTLAEPFGRDIIEAMASAKPVISTNLGGPKEIITQNSGILIESDNPEGLSSQIAKLINDPERMKILGKNARSRVEDLFELKKITKQWENLLANKY